MSDLLLGLILFVLLIINFAAWSCVDLLKKIAAPPEAK